MNTSTKTNQNMMKPDPDISELDQLERDSDEALAVLNTRQRRFVEVLVTGTSQAEAARQAGYSVHTARNKANQLLTLNYIQVAMEKLRKVHALKYGRPPSWKRKELEGLLEVAKQQENVAAGDKVLRSLMELDGDIRKHSGSGSNTTIQIIGLDRQAGVTIDHEPAKKLINTPEPS